jgi:hypothetical protein
LIFSLSYWCPGTDEPPICSAFTGGFRSSLTAGRDSLCGGDLVRIAAVEDRVVDELRIARLQHHSGQHGVGGELRVEQDAPVVVGPAGGACGR